MTLQKEPMGSSIPIRLWVASFTLLSLVWILTSVSQAQIILDGSLGGTPGQQVGTGTLSSGKTLSDGATTTDHLITHDLGTTVGNNLFHSFSEFSIGVGKSATFSGPDSIANVLSRVTGGRVSNIDGALASTIDNANIFLLNPAGVIFGQSATLDVRGGFYTSTADFIQLGEDGFFYANLEGETSVLSMAPPEAFGFLNEKPQGVVIKESAIEIPVNKTLSIVAGDIEIKGGGLNAPSGRILLASTASPSNVLFGPSSNFQVESEQLGEISLSSATSINAGGDGGGTVIIRGGELMIDGSTVTVSRTAPFNGNSEAKVDIKVTGDVLLNNGSVLQSNVFSNGNEGLAFDGIRVKANHFEVGKDSSIQLTASPESPGGGGGHIDVEANSLLIRDSLFPTGGIVTSTSGSAHGGNIFLNINESFEVRDGGFVATAVLAGAGNAGDIEVHAGKIIFSGRGTPEVPTRIISTANPFQVDPPPTGSAGNIRVITNRFEMEEASISTVSEGPGNSGNIEVIVNDGMLSLIDSGITTQTIASSGDAGSIEISVKGGEVFIDSGTIFSGIRGTGTGGSVHFDAGIAELTNGASIGVDNFSPQRAGSLTVTITDHLIVQKGSFIDVTSRSPADAADLMITAKDIVITGESIVTTQTGSDGRGGNLNIMAENLSVKDQSRINSEAEGSGDAGNIKIELTGNLLLSNGASVTAESTSQSDDAGNAGNIQLAATDTILLDGAKVTTEAAQASGGNINLQAKELIRLNGSTIASSVQGDVTTVGGNISLDPEFIILENSQILAKAVEGQGGNISLVATDAILVDPLSVLDASSALGVSGSVDIQAPIQNLSGTIAPLPEEATPVTALYGARCAAGQGGHFSTFVDSKAESLSSAPGTFLSSPLLLSKAQAVPNAYDSPQIPVALTASVVPLVLGQNGEPMMACP